MIVIPRDHSSVVALKRSLSLYSGSCLPYKRVPLRLCSFADIQLWIGSFELCRSVWVSFARKCFARHGSTKAARWQQARNTSCNRDGLGGWCEGLNPINRAAVRATLLVFNAYLIYNLSRLSLNVLLTYKGGDTERQWSLLKTLVTQEANCKRALSMYKKKKKKSWHRIVSNALHSSEGFCCVLERLHRGTIYRLSKKLF